MCSRKLHGVNKKGHSEGVLAMVAGFVYTRLPGVSQACRPHHSAGGDDAGQRLPSIQGWPSLCPELAQALPFRPHGNTGMYIVLDACSIVNPPFFAWDLACM